MAYIRVFCLFVYPQFMHVTTREKGNKGEEIACYYLTKHGFLIVERNYLKKWGEIDIIAQKDDLIHFIEVKSSTFKKGLHEYRPEENVHNLKMGRLKRAIQTYLIERHQGLDVEFKFHIITVLFYEETRKCVVKMLPDIIL